MIRRTATITSCLLALALHCGCGRGKAQVQVELFTVLPLEGKSLAYGHRATEMPRKDVDPDTVARGLLASGCRPAILHSTSWRWEKDGRLVLTYLAFTEDAACRAGTPSSISWDDLVPPSATDPQKPRPEVIREVDVLSHGIRHLTFLVRYSQDRRVADALSPRSREFFLGMCGQLAGRFETAQEFTDCAADRVAPPVP